MNRFRGLIFDVDGTMAETEELHRRAFNESFVHFGLDWLWDQDLYRKLLLVTGGKERISHFQRQHADEGAGLDGNQVAELHRFKTARYAELVAAGSCPLRPGVAEIISSARSNGQAVAIATTTSRGNVDALLTPVLGSKWQELFNAIVAGDEVAKKKPAPDVYLSVLAALDFPASSCLAFEDSRNGLLAAQSAGIPVVISRSMYFGDETFDGALCVVQELSELEAILSQGIAMAEKSDDPRRASTVQ
ncbi:MAG: HAD family hydrolase [Bradyrhizobium sp.]|nr:HAD family hydrolase [Bradyrhizobium sp.]